MLISKLKRKFELPDLEEHEPEREDVHYVVQRQDRAVYKPDGSLLFALKTGVIPREVCKDARPLLRLVGSSVEGSRRGAVRRGRNFPHSKEGFFGFMERRERYREACRSSRFNKEHPEEYRQLSESLLRYMNDAYRANAPAEYAAQMKEVQKTRSSYIIPGTCFSTATVNQNVSCAYHRDAHNEGYGVMAVLSEGDFFGGDLLLPTYRIGVQVRTGDVLIASTSDELHGNTAMELITENAERISVVAYYRRGLQQCGTFAEETARRQARLEMASVASLPPLTGATRLVVNPRGSFGSGKSTLMRELIASDPGERWLSSAHGVVTYLPRYRAAIIGTYDTPCAGCDRMSFPAIKGLLRELWGRDVHILFEGVLVSGVIETFYNLMVELRQEQWRDCRVCFLNTTVEECIRRIAKRNGGQPFSEENVRRKADSVQKSRQVYESMGLIACAELDTSGTPQEVLARFLALHPALGGRRIE